MDLRVEYIFNQATKGDTSFTEKDTFIQSLFGGTTYSQSEMRETWKRGIKHGIEIGLRVNSLEGQMIELNKNTKDPRHQEFIDRFYRLADEFNCRIQYHPEYGMCIVDLKPNY